MGQNERPVFIMLFSILSCALLFGGGNAEKNTITIPSEFCDFNLVLNEEAPPDVLDQFFFNDSTGGYGYYSRNSEKLFDTIDIYLQWRKWGKIKEIVLHRRIPLQIYSAENYKPEHVMKICNNTYGKSEISYRSKGSPVIETGGFIPIENMLLNKWIRNNFTIEYRYLPFTDFCDLKLNIMEIVKIPYILTYSVTNG
jgi:hypothetical protein